MNERPFTISVPDEAVDDLRRRLRQTRWPDTVAGSGWAHGVDVDWMKSMADYWLNRYDWPAQERALNEHPHWIAEIDGFRIHYLHFRSLQARKSRRKQSLLKKIFFSFSS